MDSLTHFAETLVAYVWSTPLACLLLGCGLAFSILTKFTQYRILTHGVACTRGHYDRPEDTGHINHFQALCAALSATVGLGNIAGVAVAVSLGGPGAVFWMWVAGALGMALKYMECTLAVMYRDVREYTDKDGTIQQEVRGGPMWYIQKGIVEPMRSRGNPAWRLFRVLALVFAASVMLSAIGQGNMFQGWNVKEILRVNFNVPPYASSTIVACLVALVIIGGIKRIGHVAGALVPFMCVAYVLGAIGIIVLHAAEIPSYLSLIARSAFSDVAAEGAFAGVTVWAAFACGLRRAAFSNEAGEGSAPIAHAAAKTDEPIREGVVAGLEPFVDTVIICTMSGLVILMTGAWNRPAIGTVTATTPTTITVACNHEDVPEAMQRAYARELVQAGLRQNRDHTYSALAVHLAERPGLGPDTLSIPIGNVERVESEAWDRVHCVTLDTAQIDDPTARRDLAKRIAEVEPGMKVHLNMDGAELTRFAFDVNFPGFGKYIVTLGVCLFAFSTMISWSYYGEKGAEFLFGPRAILPYKMVFVAFVVVGMLIRKFSLVYDFSDAIVGLLFFWNLPAVFLLGGRVIRAGREYFRKLDAGAFPRTR